MTDTSKTNEETIKVLVDLAQEYAPLRSKQSFRFVNAVRETLVAKDAQRDEAVREAVREEALWWFRLNTSFMKCARMQDIGELNRLCNLIEERVKTLNETTPQEGTPNTTHHG